MQVGSGLLACVCADISMGPMDRKLHVVVLKYEI
jgi:hypothetical protein